MNWLLAKTFDKISYIENGMNSVMYTSWLARLWKVHEETNRFYFVREHTPTKWVKRMSIKNNDINLWNDRMRCAMKRIHFFIIRVFLFFWEKLVYNTNWNVLIVLKSNSKCCCFLNVQFNQILEQEFICYLFLIKIIPPYST